jgi:hypothetical protein
MIKKILSSFLVSSVLLFLGVTASLAERPTIAIGGTVSYGGYVSSGQETEGATNVEVSHKETEAMEIGYTSLFAEVTVADRVTIGIDYMADSVTTDTSTRTDSTKSGAAGTAVTDGNNFGTSSVEAEFSDMITGYVEVRLFNGFYAKYGAMEIDIETKESLHTDSSYPNITLKGNSYGFGFKNTWDNGVFVKSETMLHDWNPISITASGCTDTCNNTKVTGSLDGAVATFKIGKQF